MGIVKISDRMHEDVRVAGQALCRSMNAQAEHWMRLGMLSELYPSLDHAGICRLLIRIEQAGGLDLASLPEHMEAAQKAASSHSSHLPHVLSASS